MAMNEVNLLIGADDKTRILKGTMQNIYDIEDNVGSIFALAKRAAMTYKDTGYRDALKIKELIEIIYCGLNGNSDNNLERVSIEKEIFARGYSHFIVPVGKFLLMALQGGEAQKKGVQEPATPNQETTNLIGKASTE